MDQFLIQAIDLAKEAVGLVSPNPAVGALIVRNGKVIGKGYTKQAGKNHAEIEALNSVKNKKLLKDATMYVTLEPCAHSGKTAPCADAVVSAGIKKVVIGMKDPFTEVNGKGIGKLKKAGIGVELLNKKLELFQEVKNLNQPFLKFVKTGLPFVTLKAAVSLDGKIATRVGDSKWISSESSRKDSRIERGAADSVLVGVGTVNADNPELAAHGKFKNKKLLRVVIDPELKSNIKSKIFRDQNVFIAHTDRASKKNILKFKKSRINIKSFGKKKVSIKALLKYLGQKSIQHIFVEGGGGVHGSFHDAALSDKILVDRVLWYLSPKIIGGENSVDSVAGNGIRKINQVLKLEQKKIKQIGQDLKIELIVNQY